MESAYYLKTHQEKHAMVKSVYSCLDLTAELLPNCLLNIIFQKTDCTDSTNTADAHEPHRSAASFAQPGDQVAHG